MFAFILFFYIKIVLFLYVRKVHTDFGGYGKILSIPTFNDYRFSF